MDTTLIIRQLEDIYGPGEGLRVFTTIMPGILADFRKMLDQRPPYASVREDYRLEDKKATIRLTGSKAPDGEVTLSAVLIPG